MRIKNIENDVNIKTKIFLGLLMLSLLFVLSACTVSNSPAGALVCESDSSCSPSTSDDSEFVKIPLSEVSSTMNKFVHRVGSTEINYFVVMGTDGEVRTAFDACDVCGGHKGYIQQGSDVVCVNCGKVFRIDDIGSKNGPGGCWPSFLDHEIEDGFVLINKDELAAGKYRFV